MLLQRQKQQRRGRCRSSSRHPASLSILVGAAIVFASSSLDLVASSSSSVNLLSSENSTKIAASSSAASASAACDFASCASADGGASSVAGLCSAEATVEEQERLESPDVGTPSSTTSTLTTAAAAATEQGSVVADEERTATTTTVRTGAEEQQSVSADIPAAPPSSEFWKIRPDDVFVFPDDEDDEDDDEGEHPGNPDEGEEDFDEDEEEVDYFDQEVDDEDNVDGEGEDGEFEDEFGDIEEEDFDQEEMEEDYYDSWDEDERGDEWENDPTAILLDEDGNVIHAPGASSTDGGPSPPGSAFTDWGEDLGEKQHVQNHEVFEAIGKARAYMEKVRSDPTYASFVALCTNRHPECASWASLGECTANPRFMKRECAPVCQSCDHVHASVRCRIDPARDKPEENDAFRPGDMDRMFDRILTDPWYQQYEPIALSRPYYAEGDTEETAPYQLGMWLVVLNNFSAPEERAALVQHGYRVGYNRSADVGEERPDGTYGDSVNSGRTSHNSWCDPECSDDPLAKSVILKMENITGIPESYQEHLQLLKYEHGQHYQTHNDYIPHQRYRKIGPRILTFFLYLNDDGLTGGETDFPRLGLKVQPKAGRAVLWPSVLNDDPNANDPRSDHGALPVKDGVKYGANAWIHLRDVKNDDLDCL